jgi:hypothetical protein
MVLSAKAGEVGVRRALFGDLNREKDIKMSEQGTKPVICKLGFMEPWGSVHESKGFHRFTNECHFLLKQYI